MCDTFLLSATFLLVTLYCVRGPSPQPHPIPNTLLKKPLSLFFHKDFAIVTPGNLLGLYGLAISTSAGVLFFTALIFRLSPREGERERKRERETERERESLIAHWYTWEFEQNYWNNRQRNKKKPSLRPQASGLDRESVKRFHLRSFMAFQSFHGVRVDFLI